jgi:hypothetical protein
MRRSLFGKPLGALSNALPARGRRTNKRARVQHSPVLESLEGRALLAVAATGTITSAPAGSNFAYTITLNNTGTTPIETFWYAWIQSPFEDFLKTSPISETSPSGWSPQITNIGSNDGYAIEWTTTTAPLNPGGSLTFSFVSADNPASVNGDSVFYPGTPVGTSFVYSGAAFTTPSDQFVVAPLTPPPPPPPPAPPPPPPPSSSTPLVTVTNVQDVAKKGMVSQIDVFFSAPVNSGDAQNAALYQLVEAGKKGSFLARNALHLKLKSASYDAALNEVILTPKKRFKLTKNVELTVNGSGILDTQGRMIDGANNGAAGSNAVAILSRRGVTLE